jgi:hypothetical protein
MLQFAKPRQRTALQVPGGPIHIFVLIDALGWTYLEGRDFLAEMLPFRTPLRTVLGFSSGAIPTILTGVPPAKNGHWNLFYYDPKNSPFRWLKYFGFLPDRLLDSRVARKIVKELGRRILGMGPLFECFVSPRLMPWFNWVEKRSIYSPGGITGARSIFDELAARGVDFCVYTYHNWKDDEILSKAREDITTSNTSVFFLYLSEVDHFLHFHCNEPHRIDKILAHYAERLRALYKHARTVSADVTMTVFSDHGMTPVRNHYGLVSEIEALGFKAPGDYLAVYDSTMARFWFFDERARQGITAALKQISCGEILSQPELTALGLNFADNRYGDLIFLLHPGWLISNSNFSKGGWQPLGMHGYHPDDSCSDAIFLSTRDPGRPMRTIADVHGCLKEAVTECQKRVV